MSWGCSWGQPDRQSDMRKLCKPCTHGIGVHPYTCIQMTMHPCTQIESASKNACWSMNNACMPGLNSRTGCNKTSAKVVRTQGLPSRPTGAALFSSSLQYRAFMLLMPFTANPSGTSKLDRAHHAVLAPSNSHTLLDDPSCKEAVCRVDEVGGCMHMDVEEVLPGECACAHMPVVMG